MLPGPLYQLEAPLAEFSVIYELLGLFCGPTWRTRLWGSESVRVFIIDHKLVARLA